MELAIATTSGATECDVAITKDTNRVQSSFEIGLQLGSKGFCIIDPGVETEVFKLATREVDELNADGSFSAVPSLVAEGLLGTEGSSHVFRLEDAEDGLAECPRLQQVDEVLNEMASLVQVTLPSLGADCPERSLAVVHETGLDPQGSLEVSDQDVSDWLPVFSRARILILAILGPIRGTLELAPFAEDAEPLEVPTVPGRIIVLRTDRMSHKHFANSQAYILSCFMLESANSRTETFVPLWRRQLENWTVQRLQELKEEEDETGRHVAVPVSGWRGAMDRMFHTEQRCAIRGVASRHSSSWQPFPWWSGQVAGVDYVTSIPLMRWDYETSYDTGEECWRKQKTFAMHGSFAEGLELFDSRFFGISPMEAKTMDPHQRQVLEVGYEACNRAGYTKSKLMNRLGGVYLGSSMTVFGNIHETGATGGAASINANRFSFCLGLKGPSLTVDSEGASSLSAVHLGSENVVQKGRGVINDFSLCGGVYFNLSPLWWPQMQARGLLSRKGRCFAWDATADGYCLGDGIGFIVVRRLAETVDGERAYVEDDAHLEGTIAGTNLNSSGRTASMHAPNSASLQELFAEVLRSSHTCATSVNSYECDARGVVMDDAVEAAAASRILRGGANMDFPAPVMFTSVKTNIGSAHEAAGISSLVKALISSKMPLATPNCHLYEINPYMDPDDKVQYMSEVQKFDQEATYYGITSRGFCGSNAHVLFFGQPSDLEETAPADEKPSLIFWPGGGGELEDEQVPLRGYYIAGTFSKWKAEPMQQCAGGCFSATVTIGENEWEDFQILLDGDVRRRLHPWREMATKDSVVGGPSAEVGSMKWRIDARRFEEIANPVDSHALASSANERRGIGEVYKVILHIAGKYRRVTWSKLPLPADPDQVPRGTFFVTSTWNGWTLDSMTPDADGGCTLDACLVSGSGDFRIVRNEDWEQQLCPSFQGAGSGSAGVGPDTARAEKAGLFWRVSGSAADIVRLHVRRGQHGSDWSVTWTMLRTEIPSMSPSSETPRTRLGVAGTWDDFARQRELEFESGDGKTHLLSFIATLGIDGFESFHLFHNLLWDRPVYPDRYVDDAQNQHRIITSAASSSASAPGWDLNLPVWCIGRGMDSGSPGQHVKVTAQVAMGRVAKVSWAYATQAEVNSAKSDGRLVSRS